MALLKTVTQIADETGYKAHQVRRAIEWWGASALNPEKFGQAFAYEAFAVRLIVRRLKESARKPKGRK